MKRECPFCTVLANGDGGLARHAIWECIPSPLKTFTVRGRMTCVCVCGDNFVVNDCGFVTFVEIIDHWEEHGGLTAHVLHTLMTKGELK